MEFCLLLVDVCGCCCCFFVIVFSPLQTSVEHTLYNNLPTTSQAPTLTPTPQTHHHLHTKLSCIVSLKAGTVRYKLPGLVYDILPSTTAVFSYAIGSRKLSANEQVFFVGAQTVVSLLQTTQIISDVCFITDHVAYQNGLNRGGTLFFLLFFLPGVDAPHVYVRARALGWFYSHITTQTFRRALTASVDSCAETKSAPSVA